MQAAITFVNSTSASSTTNSLSFVAAGNSAADTGFNANLTPGLPAGIEENDLLLLLIEKGDNSTTMVVPASWTLLSSDTTSTTTHQAYIYWKYASDAETAPNITRSGNFNLIFAQIFAFRGVEKHSPVSGASPPTPPFDGNTSITFSNADLTTEAGAITTLTPNAMILFAAMMANDHASIGTPAGSTPWATCGNCFSTTTTGNDGSLSLHYGVRATAGNQAAVTATRTGTGGQGAAVSNGAQISLRPPLTIDIPSGTTTGDVMIASIAARPNSGTITPPAGWTLLPGNNALGAGDATHTVIQTGGQTHYHWVYYKVATASEPARYTWSISGTLNGLVGSIMSFRGVDTTSPIINQAGAATPSSLSHPTNATGFDTTVANAMVVTHHVYESSASWTAPTDPVAPTGTMSTAVNISSYSSSGGNVGLGIAMGGFYRIQATATNTGVRTASAASDADPGTTHILALRPLGGTATVTTPATGGSAISADSVGGTYTILTGPVISETDTGGMQIGSYILTAPAGFQFNTTANSVSIAISTASGTGTDINLGGGAGTTVTVTPTASTITFNVTALSGSTKLNRLTFSGIRVRPTTGCPLVTTGNIIFGTSTTTTITSNNAGTLTEVVGTAARIYTVLPGQTAYGASTCGTISGTPNNQTAGTPFNVTFIATDQFGNIQTSYTGSKTITYSGPGATVTNTPAYTNSVTFTSGQGTLSTTLYKAETTTITATDGSLTGIASSSFTVVAATANRMHVVLPGQSFVSGTGATGTPNNQVLNVSFLLTSLVATDQYYNTANYNSSPAITYTLSPLAAGSTFTSPVTFSAGTSTTLLNTTITIAGTYTLTASGGGLTGVVSSSFIITDSFACAGWPYHKTITIDHTKVGTGGVTDFPVLINITDNDLKTKALASGNDILFTDAAGTTKLAHEIERYNSSTGELIAWVKVPNVSSATDTVINMYYGNPSASSQQSSSQVWDANFRMVQHLQETGNAGTTLFDSTANGNNGTVIGNPSFPTYLANEKIDGARNHPGSGTGTRPVLEFPHSSSLAITGSITAEAWAYIESGQPAPDHNPVIFKGTQIGWGANYLFRIAAGPGGSMTWGVTCGGNEGWFEAGAPVFNQWAHYALTYDGTTTRAYINGVLQTISNNAGGATTCSGQALNITAAAPVRSGYTPGRSTPTEEAFLKGRTDELRISSTARSVAWLLTEYNNQNSPSTFYSISSEFVQNCIVLDHIRIEHDGLGLTCAPETVTVRACTDASCSSEYTGSVTTTLIPNGWVGGDTINFSGGSTAAQLRITTPGNIVLGAVSTNPAPSGNSRCFIGGTETCAMEFKDSGFIFDVPTLTSHKTSSPITITAVRTDQTSQTCAPAFTGAKTVNFWSTYSNPNTGTRQVQINGGNIATSSPGTGISLTFDANAQSTFTVRYPDAGEMLLNAQYDGTGAESGLVMTGNDQFISVPAGLCVESTDTNSDCSSGDASCSAFKKAGESFNLTVRGVGWEADGETNEQFCSGNGSTPNFRLSTIGLASTLVAPVGGNGATLGVNSVDIVAADNGSHIQNDETISEVGVFTITATPPAYFGETIAASTSANIGRFIPWRFEVTANTPTFANSCTGFTYMDQTFYYATAPQFTVTAKNASGGTTTNYGGGNSGANGFVMFGSMPTISRTFADGQVTPPSASFSGTEQGNVTLTGEADFNGEITFTLENGTSGDAFLYSRNAPEAPFNSDVDITFSGSGFTDNDGVCYDSAATPGKCNINDADTADPYKIKTVGATEQRFGRLVIGTAAGSELLPLSVPLRTEYFDGTEFTRNDNDSCSILTLAGDIQLSNPDTAGGTPQPGGTTMTVGAGTSSITSGNALFTNGMSTLTFSAPGVNGTGFIDVLSNLIVSGPDHLLDDRDNDGVYDNNVAGRVTFGVFEGPRTYIYTREPW